MNTTERHPSPTLNEAMTSVMTVALDQFHAMAVDRINCWSQRLQEHLAQEKDHPTGSEVTPWMIGACAGAMAAWLLTRHRPAP